VRQLFFRLTHERDKGRRGLRVLRHVKRSLSHACLNLISYHTVIKRSLNLSVGYNQCLTQQISYNTVIEESSTETINATRRYWPNLINQRCAINWHTSSQTTSQSIIQTSVNSRRGSILDTSVTRYLSAIRSHRRASARVREARIWHQRAFASFYHFCQGTPAFARP